MDNFNTSETLFDMALDLDEAALERDVETIIVDEDIRLFLRENRIALVKGNAVQVQSEEAEASKTIYYDIPLFCIIHAHPECRFEWARLVVDLSVTKDARIHDMAPREVRGDKPVELKTTVGIDLKFEVIANILGGDISAEHTTSHTVYYPEIISSGLSSARGYWDFLASKGERVHVDKELRLLVSAPKGHFLQARFKLWSKVRVAGIVGLLPLFVKGNKVNEIYRLG